MKDLAKYGIIGLSIVLFAYIIGKAFTYRYRTQDTIAVTGLGEEAFTSDLIVWKGTISVKDRDKQSGYTKIAAAHKVVANYLKSQGLPDKAVTFNFVESRERTYSKYEDGKYAGEYFLDYYLEQDFTVESNDVELVENISRDISSLLSRGIDLDIRRPNYYYTKLDEVKQQLIEKASKDALERATNIATNAGAKIGKPASARLGVFQITDALGEDEYDYGGTFNTTSKEKKGRITIRVEYRIK